MKSKDYLIFFLIQEFNLCYLENLSVHNLLILGTSTEASENDIFTDEIYAEIVNKSRANIF